MFIRTFCATGEIHRRISHDRMMDSASHTEQAVGHALGPCAAPNRFSVCSACCKLAQMGQSSPMQWCSVSRVMKRMEKKRATINVAQVISRNAR